MDELHTNINNFKAIKRDYKSLKHFATTIACYVSVMDDNIGCPVLESVEAPFLMFQLLSKLDSIDNSDFGREIKGEGKEETVVNLYHLVTSRSEYSFSRESEHQHSAKKRNSLRQRSITTENKTMTIKQVLLAVRPNISWLHVLSFRF